MKFNLIDVGSIGGFTLPWTKSIVDYILKVDPFDISRPDDKTRIVNACAFDRDCCKEFYVLKKKDCSSLFRPNKKAIKSIIGFYHQSYRISRVKNVKCITLDSLLNNLDIKYNFLKTDAQGAELNILMGCKKNINNFVGLHLEVFHKEFYEGIGIKKDIDKFLLDYNFTCEMPLKSGKKHWRDYLYINESFRRSLEAEFILNLYSSLRWKK